CLQDYSIPWTF
nr:immunoglobulin light chain junction region [Macaca mulatta]MOV62864.1 immunoglobulin light chain junction region [Macaca mulatta]MOV63179.1 immunoglobulin light chain junction region [Macaca mulatta]MOV63424.1 immunoglobulin light chain junction region [Macaca mulatta]MOV64016.1 immunoglobulin light chain junction region [Macaca mulatta]